MEKLAEVFNVLYSKKDEVERFFNHYIFELNEINKDKFIDDKNEFIKFMNFCLSTGRYSGEEKSEKATMQLNEKYDEIVKLIKDKKIEELKVIIYGIKGIGQKIGSLALEIIFLYSKYKDETAAKELFVPIDVHVKRIFKASFGKETPEIESKQTDPDFIIFQESLDQYTNNRSRIYFDYLWFVGKMFCTKITDENNKGYKLCNYCWIKEYCENDKWL